jgi:2-polyprenyl-3-methyl-5-hydroxy-6-metoxy-1,4-benzoquinol methylase
MNRFSMRGTCRLCNSPEVREFLSLGDSPIADAYVAEDRVGDKQECFPLNVCLCQACGHVQLRHVVNPELIYREYLYVTHSSPGLVDYYARYAAEMTQRTKLAMNSLVMDIGSNDGALLRAFQSLGMRVLGVDPAREIARRATQSGIFTVPEFFTPDLAAQLCAEHGKADLVTANNIVANVDDVPEFFSAVATMLAEDGFFVLESGYWLDIVDNMLFDTVYHEHLSYFSILPLQRFVAEHTPLSLVDVLHTPSKGGCLRYVFAKKSQGIPPSRLLCEMAAHEETIGLDRLPFNAGFAEKVEQSKRNTLALLEQLAGANKRLVAYGASNTTTTLFYHYGLGKFFDSIVDDNPIKIGLFSPGLHIPVLAPSSLYTTEPDYIFIAAWRFADGIMQRHPAFAGKWIIPLPESRFA